MGGKKPGMLWTGYVCAARLGVQRALDSNVPSCVDLFVTRVVVPQLGDGGCRRE